MSKPIIYYYKSKYAGAGRWQVTIWTKPDRSNSITETFVTVDEEKIRRRIESVCGHKNIELVRMKGER